MNRRKFDESELWYLLHSLASVGKLYHQEGEKVGNIAPNYVFMSEKGMIKIASLNSWPGQKTNYENALYEKEAAYLAPEEVKDLEIGKKLPDASIELAEAFSTGLTALDAMTLSNSDRLYSSRGFDF